MFRKIFKRKKGSVIIEFIAVFPIFIALVFGGIEMFTYILVNGTAQEAAKEGARVVAVELRDQPGEINASDIEPARYEYVVNTVLKNKVTTIMENNGFIDYEVTADEIITDENGGKEACEAAKKDGEKLKEDLLCVYTENEQINDRGNEQVVVEVKTPYESFANFVPFVEYRIIDGKGAVAKQEERRYEYFGG